MLTRDFTHFIPASDAVFAAYKVMYQYDNTPLNARVEGTVRQTADWRLEKVSFATAYRNERMAAFLYIPTHVRPPYQTVIFFPSARVLSLHDSRTLGDTAFFDYIVQSGRAVLYPIYQDTYERRLQGTMPGASQEIALTTERYKDVARAIDYLETRPDIDHDRLAYLGVSAGAAQGAIYATLAQDRLRTAIFLDGGYFLDEPPAGRRPGGLRASHEEAGVDGERTLRRDLLRTRRLRCRCSGCSGRRPPTRSTSCSRRRTTPPRIGPR